ncbi:hypothetical protein V7S43_018391 [Phytophthora oleae]|uniref:Uncharacterized protein n=1 Tax=Phytophthora oleae TaxID=2107226 RepID=A0ABD3ER01_9STRA
MKATLLLKNPENFGENFQPDEDQVHVLVVLPNTQGRNDQQFNVPIDFPKPFMKLIPYSNTYQ